MEKVSFWKEIPCEMQLADEDNDNHLNEANLVSYNIDN